MEITNIVRFLIEYIRFILLMYEVVKEMYRLTTDDFERVSDRARFII